jgi:hypothetical protein
LLRKVFYRIDMHVVILLPCPSTPTSKIGFSSAGVRTERTSNRASRNGRLIKGSIGRIVVGLFDDHGVYESALDDCERRGVPSFICRDLLVPAT